MLGGQKKQATVCIRIIYFQVVLDKTLLGKWLQFLKVNISKWYLISRGSERLCAYEPMVQLAHNLYNIPTNKNQDTMGSRHQCLYRWLNLDTFRMYIPHKNGLLLNLSYKVQFLLHWQYYFAYSNPTCRRLTLSKSTGPPPLIPPASSKPVDLYWSFIIWIASTFNPHSSCCLCN